MVAAGGRALAVTLRLLQQEGYDGLTLDAVAATARASKATVYRRWPTKAELVLAAFIEGVRQVAVAPETGTLRGDLIQIAEVCCEQAREHASTMRAVLVEVSRNPALNDVMQHQFLDQRKALIDHVLAQAVDRGEIEAAAITEDLWDVMPGYLIFRSIWSAAPPTRRTVQALVDDVIIPQSPRPCGLRRVQPRPRAPGLCRAVPYRTVKEVIYGPGRKGSSQADHRVAAIERLVGAGDFDGPPASAMVDAVGRHCGGGSRGLCRVPPARRLRLQSQHVDWRRLFG